MEQNDERTDKHSSERRAENIAWNSSGNYGFKPAFLSYNDDGSPNLYIDCIVGLVRKWYDQELLDHFFTSYAGDFRSESFDNLVWLMLESGAYALEESTGERPALNGLRLSFAESFFENEQTLSRQQWMVNNNLVYTMQCARWSKVLGKRQPMMSLSEIKLSTILDCGPEPSTSDIIASMRMIFLNYYHYNGTVKERHGLRLHLGKRTAAFLSRFVPSEIKRSDNLQFDDHKDKIRDEGGLSSHNVISLVSSMTKDSAVSDRMYIEKCFGRLIITPEKLRRLESSLCTGIHEKSHLWFTDGSPSSSDSSTSAEYEHILWEMNKQYKKNLKYYNERTEQFRNETHRLTEMIRGTLTSRRSLYVHHSLTGRLEPDNVWKADILGSSHLFLHTEDDTAPDISVTLLLDSSASKSGVQEETAAQGYIIGSALAKLHIPVEVLGFCSLRGYTVIRIFADNRHPENMKNVFHYTAAGWNRDGLALRAAGHIASQSRAGLKFLIILTDASPNDLQRAAAKGKYGLSQDYGGDNAVEDTAAEVHELKKDGIHVMAVFSGRDACASNAEKIYSADHVRIHQADKLAEAVSSLIKKQLN